MRYYRNFTEIFGTKTPQYLHQFGIKDLNFTEFWLSQNYECLNRPPSAAKSKLTLKHYHGSLTIYTGFIKKKASESKPRNHKLSLETLFSKRFKNDVKRTLILFCF